MKLKPRLNHFQLFGDKGFNQDETLHQIDDEWFVMGEFSIYDEHDRAYNATKPFYKRRRGNRDGDLGYLFEIIICSPGFVPIATKYIEGQVPKEFFTLAKFSKQEARDKLDAILKGYGEVTIEQLRERLAHFCDVSELDYTLKNLVQES